MNMTGENRKTHREQYSFRFCSDSRKTSRKCWAEIKNWERILSLVCFSSSNQTWVSQPNFKSPLPSVCPIFDYYVSIRWRRSVEQASGCSLRIKTWCFCESMVLKLQLIWWWWTWNVSLTLLVEEVTHVLMCWRLCLDADVRSHSNSNQKTQRREKDRGHSDSGL